MDAKITVEKPTPEMFVHNNRNNFSSNAFVFAPVWDGEGGEIAMMCS